jgi:response regulator RpfG family c-di-GMP phosphodiesterase
MNDTVLPLPAATIAPLTILCVDDEANILNAMRRLLRPHGYNVLTAPSGADGLDVLAATAIDLVISDMRMPEMDGAHFLEQVKARSPDTVRVLLTGYADLSSTVAAINAGGIYRYIAKPWDDKALLDILKDALTRKLLEREKARLEQLTFDQNEQLKALNETLEAKVRARTRELAQALSAIENAHDKLKKSFATSIRVFANLIELREGAMAGHSRHVADCARRIAKRMKLAESEVQDVMLAGLLHGIGELGISDSVLGRSLSALSPEDRTAVMKHPVKAQAALMALEQLADAGTLIRSYRERYDGAGYPDRLSGIAIPVGARILAVAHDYEAGQEGTLTGRWLSKVQAREYISQGRGSRYDPQVVDAFFGILDAEGVARVSGKAVLLRELQEGMVLARDIVTADGLMLLSKGSLLNAATIEQLRRYEFRDHRQINVHVEHHDAARSSA